MHADEQHKNPWKRVRSWILGAFATVSALVLLIVAGVVAASQSKLRHQYPIPPESELRVADDSASIARGAHLASAVAVCALCHGQDLGGSVYMDGPLGIVAGTNLTNGRSGGPLTTTDWEHAVRHGVRRDGTSLIIMPAEVFTYLSDDDLGAIIAYARHLPSVRRDMPRTRFRALGRTLLAVGKLPILTAPKTPAGKHSPPQRPDTTAEYGRYLASISGCHGCHGYGLSGGRVAGPPDVPPAANLTPAGIGAWAEADFVRAMRQGRRPDGSAINPFMPWTVLRGLTDDELHALWIYLKSVPPRETGNK